MLKKLILCSAIVLLLSGCSNKPSENVTFYSTEPGQNYDLILYKTSKNEKVLITESVNSITVDLDENFALNEFSTIPNGKIYFASYLPESDNLNSYLYSYKTENNTIEKVFQEQISPIFTKLNNSKDKFISIDTQNNRVFTYDLVKDIEIMSESIPENLYYSNPTMDGLGENYYAEIGWTSDTTSFYTLFNSDGTYADTVKNTYQ